MARFKIQDREYEFDGEYTTEEAMLFWDKANVGMAELAGALQRGNPYVALTLMYILKKRAGEAIRWQDLAHIPVSEFTLLPDPDAVDADGDMPEGSEGPREAADPTKDGGTTPEPDTATTS